MKVSGFTFIKNAIIYDYPVVEAIQSILPICDEFVVAVGKSEDETLALIQQIDPQKIKIVETVWDDSLREGGRVLALETDKAFANIAEDADWAFYIQGDEVVHEKYLNNIREAMRKYKDSSSVDGLLFKYEHFYGSYDYVGASSNWYAHEIRVIKNKPSIYSYRDAQGFRKEDNQKLNVVPIDAYMYHYGWVKEPKSMQKKQENFNKLWHDEAWIKTNVKAAEEYDYNQSISQLRLFKDSHPEVMKNRIEKMNWKFSYDISYNKSTLKEKFKKFMLQHFGIHIGYKNYNIIKVRA